MARTAKITNANVAPSRNKGGLVGNTPVRAQDFNELVGDYLSLSDSSAQTVTGDVTFTGNVDIGGDNSLNRGSNRTADRYFLDEYFKQLPALNGVLEGSTTIDLGSIADGDEQAVDVTVTGAALGDFVTVSSSIDVTDLTLTGTVVSSNTVTVVVGNFTGGAIDLGSGNITVKVIKAGNSTYNQDFEVLGTNMTTALAAFDADYAAVKLTTAGADQDQAILTPHLDTTASAWSNIKWGTENQVEWECVISTAAIDNQKIWAGLKLTNDQLVVTDADQAFFFFRTDTTNGEFQVDYTTLYFAYSVGGVDYVTDLGITVAANTRYHLQIKIDSDRKISGFVNGVQYGLNNTSPSGAVWGDSTVDAAAAVTAGDSSGAQSLTVDNGSGSDSAALTVWSSGDVVYKSDGTVFGTIKSVDSATQITFETVENNIAEDDILYNYGQKTSRYHSTQKSVAMTDDVDFIPYIGIEAGDGAAASLRVHYTGRNRILFE